MKVTVVFVCDMKHDRVSAGPDVAKLMVRSVKHYQPDWTIRCGVVGEPPVWLKEYGVEAFPIIPPDEKLRFANKIAAMQRCGSYEGYNLFLDGDVLMCRPLDVELTADVAGVHSDYPNVSTREENGRAAYKACGVDFPTTKTKCTMYGGETWTTINVGAFFVSARICAALTMRWMEYFHSVKNLKLGDQVHTFSEQMAFMPAIDSLGLGYQLLDARYNWNGTIYPANQDVVFLHYHRNNVLDSDAVALRVLSEISK